MIQNKRGLSTIVVTLIIIVLSLVAVGVVWAVVNGLLKTGTSNVDINSKCLGLGLQITAANCSTGATDKMCDVQVVRSGTGTDVINGVKVVFRNETTTTVYTPNPIDVVGDVPALVGVRIHGVDSGLVNAVGIDTVEVTPYFKDATSGNIQLCGQTSSFNFHG
jgi:hypothetical protein